MSWHYLLEVEGESLQDICLGGEQCVPLKSKATHAEFYCNGKLMDSYLDSLCGTILEPLTENPGEEKSTSSAVDFLVKTSLQQEKELELMESDQGFGKKCFASFAKWDPISYSWKTAQISLLGDLELFLETWPQWGSMQNGECLEQVMLGPSTRETESGLWPTPTTPTGGGNVGGSGAYRNAILKGTHIPRSINPNLYEWLMGWPQGWTALEPLVMDKCQFVLQLRGEY